MIRPAVLGRRSVLGGLCGAAVLAAARTTRGAVPFRITEVVGDLVHPWSLAFLPDGTMLVTERPGRLRRIDAQGRASPPIAGVPEVAASGQGGLLDIVPDPAFSDNRTLFFSFAEPGVGGAGTAVGRGRLDLEASGGGRLAEVEVIYRQLPKVGGGLHFGSRLVFAEDGTLFVTQGERGRRDMAQDLSVLQGKIVRIDRDGRAPRDNPFIGQAGVPPEIWSYGHRNIQGAALHPETRRLWTHEHGPRGGDEINIPERGLNYGWPAITYGIDYSGAPIGVGTHRPGMEQPIHQWTPSIGPSGMLFYAGDAFPDWKGSLLVGSLVFRRLVRLTVDGRRIIGEERLLADVDERIRDVREAPDGTIYVLTDHERGRLLRLDRA